MVSIAALYRVVTRHITPCLRASPNSRSRDLDVCLMYKERYLEEHFVLADINIQDVAMRMARSSLFRNWEEFVLDFVLTFP